MISNVVLDLHKKRSIFPASSWHIYEHSCLQRIEIEPFPINNSKHEEDQATNKVFVPIIDEVISMEINWQKLCQYKINRQKSIHHCYIFFTKPVEEL